MVGSGPDLIIHVRNLEVPSTKTWTQNCLFSCDFTTMSQLKTPYTRCNPSYNRLYNRLYNQENVCIHDAAGCTTGCTTGCIVYTQLNATCYRQMENNSISTTKGLLHSPENLVNFSNCMHGAWRS